MNTSDAAAFYQTTVLHDYISLLNVTRRVISLQFLLSFDTAHGTWEKGAATRTENVHKFEQKTSERHVDGETHGVALGTASGSVNLPSCFSAVCLPAVKVVKLFWKHTSIPASASWKQQQQRGGGTAEGEVEGGGVSSQRLIWRNSGPKRWSCVRATWFQAFRRGDGLFGWRFASLKMNKQNGLSTRF